MFLGSYRYPMRNMALQMQGYRRLACRTVLAFALFVLCMLGAAPVHAQIQHQYTNSQDSAVGGINDTAASCTNPLVRNFSVSNSFTVTGVRIGVLAAHTYRGDMRMFLRAPNGTTVTLTSGSGSNGGDNFNVLFSDSAASSITNYTANDTASASTSVPPYNNTYRPQSLLSAFNGVNSAGTWQLRICDQYSADSGTFFQSDLYLAETPTTFADLSLGKTVNNSTPTSGANVTFSLTVTNRTGSTNSASNIAVTDILSPGFTFVSASGTGSYNPTTGVWSVGTLAPGASASLNIVATVSASAGATLTNRAEITASSISDFDSTPGNNSTDEDDDDSVSLTVTGTRTAGVAPALSCPKGTLLFDWDLQTWTAGSTSATKSLAGFGNLGFSITSGLGWVNNATYGGQSPTRTNVMGGGFASPEFGLTQYIDFATRAEIAQTVITLPAAVPGAQFAVFDVDFFGNQFADWLRVTGSYQGSAVTPVLTNGIANYVIGNEAFGDVLADNLAADGNVIVTFQAPVDTITVEYGNHALAPADPGGQAIAIHDIMLCKPDATLSVFKTSTIVSDPTNETNNPVAIPGAILSYCILIENTGSAAASNIVANDTIPADMTFTSGSIKSGTSCSSTPTVEDDDSSGADESDPVGASISGDVLTLSVSSLPSGSQAAIVYSATVN